MALSVPALVPVTGSTEAAQDVVDAIIEMRRQARAQIAAAKAEHARQLAITKQQGEAALAALRATYTSRRSPS